MARSLIIRMLTMNAHRSPLFDYIESKNLLVYAVCPRATTFQG